MANSVPSWVQDTARLPVAFAQVREDPLLDAWVVRHLGAHARIIMVASGGCTAALLATLANVGELQLVDPNPAQLALTRLKLHLLRTPVLAARRALLGHAEMALAERRTELTRALTALQLSPTVLGPLEQVAAWGPDHAGRYERLFARLRTEVAGSANELADLLQLRDPAEQARRVDPNTPLGKALDAAFDEVMALPNLVGLFGEEATRNRVEPFARHFARRTRHALSTLPAADNPYLGQVLLGRYPGETGAPWLDAAAPLRMPVVTYSCTVMTEALRTAVGAYDFVHLSNILDWLSPDDARATLKLAWAALRPGGWVLVRQLNSTLDIPVLGARFAWQIEQAAALHARDRSYFYRALHLGRKP
jgi:S-adenosylmethionine-diacylglycerol 3-amino-3-carboxypropyl transferase